MLTALLLAARVGSGPAMFAVGHARGGSVKRAVASDEGSEAARPPSNASSWAGRVQSCCGYPSGVRCQMLVGMNAIQPWG